MYIIIDGGKEKKNMSHTLRFLKFVSVVIGFVMVMTFIVGPILSSVFGFGVFGLMLYLMILVQPINVIGIIITLFIWLLVGLGIRHEKGKEERKKIEKRVSEEMMMIPKPRIIHHYHSQPVFG